jgi:prepilin signal peptidase PulO-like enzyme (type II secretory pathway)
LFGAKCLLEIQSGGKPPHSMDVILDTPFELRLLFLFVLGCALGAACNWATYSFAYQPRPISPWSRPPSGARLRRWFDRIPVFGWLGLAREARLHGRGFWVRPLLIEVLSGLFLAGLYWWETDELGLLTAPLQQLYRRQQAFHAIADPILHANFLSHGLLFLVMLVASLIDLDEKTIPDLVTIPGTLAGLLLMTLLPAARLPEEISVAIPAGAAPWLANVHLASPNDFPPALDGAPLLRGLAMGLGCYLLWCFALLPRSWRTRHGLGRALRIFTARIAREPFTRIVAALAVAGASGIIAVWWIAGAGWESLQSALVGLAAGGSIIWLVRIIGRYALRREAMGFGDVTLLAMIGVFLGWQACLFVFFLAPFAGLLLGVANWIAHRENELPYGPFLCLAALFVIVQWAAIWEWASPFFSVPWLVPGALVACMALMFPLLCGLRWLRK